MLLYPHYYGIPHLVWDEVIHIMILEKIYLHLSACPHSSLADSPVFVSQLSMVRCYNPALLFYASNSVKWPYQIGIYGYPSIRGEINSNPLNRLRYKYIYIYKSQDSQISWIQLVKIPGLLLRRFRMFHLHFSRGFSMDFRLDIGLLESRWGDGNDQAPLRLAYLGPNIQLGL